MAKQYRIQFEQLVTKTGYVTANSKDEAIKLAYDGEFDEDWEDDVNNFRIIEVVEE